MNCLGFGMRFQDMPLRICESELEAAIARICRQARRGLDGTCVLAWAQVAETHSRLMCSAVESWFVSTPAAGSIDLCAVAWASAGRQVRVYVPLPPIYDGLLAARIHAFLDMLK